MTAIPPLVERLDELIERLGSIPKFVITPEDAEIERYCDEAIFALQSQSARIAELEDLPRLIELQRTAAPDCDREEGWNAGLDRATDIARSSLTKDSTSAPG